MSKKIFSQLCLSPLAEISNLALSASWVFFHRHFHWLVEVWVLSEHPYRPLSLSVPQSLSLSCASLKCNLVCIWDCGAQFVSPQAQWVGMPFIFHPYLMQTASVNSCLCSAYLVTLIGKANSQEDAPLSIAPFMSCCDSGVISAKSSSWMFLHFLLLYYVFRVSGKLVVWGVVVKIEILSVYFSY